MLSFACAGILVCVRVCVLVCRSVFSRPFVCVCVCGFDSGLTLGALVRPPHLVRPLPHVALHQIVHAREKAEAEAAPHLAAASCEVGRDPCRDLLFVRDLCFVGGFCGFCGARADGWVWLGGFPPDWEGIRIRIRIRIRQREKERGVLFIL